MFVLICRAAQARFALRFEEVARVIHAAQFEVVNAQHVLNLAGERLKVIDAREVLQQPRERLALEQHFVLIRGSSPFVLWVSEVERTLMLEPEQIEPVRLEPVQAELGPNQPMQYRTRWRGEAVPILTASTFRSVGPNPVGTP
jgi:chemotaxis protein histidine kinase CheA